MVRSDDAASPSISIALSGIAGGAVSKLLSPDDGTYERYYRQTAPQAFYVNRLIPTTYPATLKTVRIYFGEDTLAPGDTITVHSGVNASGAAELTQVALRTVTGRVTRERAFLEFEVAPLTITAGDFLVGFSFEKSDTRTVAIDTDSVYRARSYYSTNGTSFRLAGELAEIGRGNFGIQAVLE